MDAPYPLNDVPVVVQEDDTQVVLQVYEGGVLDQPIFPGYKTYQTGTYNQTFAAVIDRKQEKSELDETIDFGLWVENQLV